MIPSIEVYEEAASAEGLEDGAEMTEAAEDCDSSAVSELLGHLGTGRSPTSAAPPRAPRRGC